ncbi:MAG: hypothetical protein JRE40_00290 [Deltaproteobacteria bacterium]|nr:hypothetical protein [Deltaproteobacteria bacterium]
MLKKFWNVDYEFGDYLFDEVWNIVVERLSPAQKQALSDSNVSDQAIEHQVYGIIDLGIAFGLLRHIILFIRSGIKNLWKSYWTNVTDLGTLDVFIYHKKDGHDYGN